MSSSSSPLLVPRDGGGFKFYSRQSLHRFLRISPPYNTCLAYAPSAGNAPHCSRPINRHNRYEVPSLLERLCRATVPSRPAASILAALSSDAVCGITGWHQNKASELYHEWCDDLWDAYLYAHDLDPRLWTGRTPPLNRESWEHALEEAREDQEDTSDEEEYDFDEDDGSAYDNDPISRGTTPDTTTSSFDESPLHVNGPDRSPISQASGSTIGPESSVNSQHSSRSTFDVYRDDEVRSVDPTLGQALNTVQNYSVLGDSRRVLGPLDPNIAISNPDDRTPSIWSHELSSSATSSAAESRPESRGSGSNESLHEVELNSRHSLGSEISFSTIEPSTISEETSIEGLAISRGSQALVDGPTEDEDSDTSENTEVESASQDESEDIEAYGSNQDENNGNQRPRLSVGDLGVIDHRDPEAQQDRGEEGFVSIVSPESAATVIGRDEDVPEEDVTGLITLGNSFFDDVEDVIEVAPVSSALVPAPSRPGFRRYPQARTPRAQLFQLWKIMTATVSHNRRRSGFVYAFARHSLPGFLKIGYVNAATIPQPPDPNPVDNRLARWRADCDHYIEEVFRVAIACRGVERIESLIHMTLKESRWVEDPPCSPCARSGRSKGRHNEWFEVGEQAARHVVDIWASFAAQLPYDNYGRLVNFWTEQVDGQRRHLRVGESAMSWVGNIMPRLLEELTRRELESISPLEGRIVQ
jgi:hypothetical protein